jgi:hypothetical protein
MAHNVNMTNAGRPSGAGPAGASDINPSQSLLEIRSNEAHIFCRALAPATTVTSFFLIDEILVVQRINSIHPAAVGGNTPALLVRHSRYPSLPPLPPIQSPACTTLLRAFQVSRCF